ncbi:MAG: SIMPL domain-containing protein [Candidatus Pacebacteria bacterium]|nr:SIMPL domain-containing protein [Candidatus Paceibacterota bacterium]
MEIMNGSKEMTRLIKMAGFLFIILSLFFIVKIVMVAKEIGNVDNSYNTISVNGTGEVYAVPDTAMFSFTIRTNATDVAVAQNDATEKVNTALEAIRTLGVEDKDIKTTYYNVQPKYKYGYYAWGVKENPITGYEVSQTTEVKISDTDKTGEFIAKLAELGITETTGPNFTVADEKSLQAEARKEAIDDAREKAESLATDLGVRLVRITSYYDNKDNGYPGVPLYGTMDAGMMTKSAVSTPEISTGENKITSQVTITYEIR